jgi:hypothetical protein
LGKLTNEISKKPDLATCDIFQAFGKKIYVVQSNRDRSKPVKAAFKGIPKDHIEKKID